MYTNILTDYQRCKIDKNNDELFYLYPKFVYHLDSGFRKRLTLLYREYIKPDAIILDLMSSWVSHLPPDIKYKQVIGHGLNKDELKRNTKLDKYWVQNLNIDLRLPLENNSIDYVLIVAGWQYLQFPEQIAYECSRITKPKGKIIVSFSNRAFWNKAPNIWVNSNDTQRLNYVASTLLANGWKNPFIINENRIRPNMFNFFKFPSDPFLSLISEKS